MSPGSYDLSISVDPFLAGHSFRLKAGCGVRCPPTGLLLSSVGVLLRPHLFYGFENLTSLERGISTAR